MPDFKTEYALQFAPRYTILLSLQRSLDFDQILMLVIWWYYVGDIVMSATLRWLVSDVGGRIIMLATFFGMLVIFLMYWNGHQYPE